MSKMENDWLDESSTAFRKECYQNWVESEEASEIIKFFIEQVIHKSATNDLYYLIPILEDVMNGMETKEYLVMLLLALSRDSAKEFLSNVYDTIIEDVIEEYPEYFIYDGQE